MRGENSPSCLLSAPSVGVFCGCGRGRGSKASSRKSMILGQMTVSEGILCSVSHVKSEACFLEGVGPPTTVFGVVWVVRVEGVGVSEQLQPPPR